MFNILLGIAGMGAMALAFGIVMGILELIYIGIVKVRGKDFFENDFEE